MSKNNRKRNKIKPGKYLFKNPAAGLNGKRFRFDIRALESTLQVRTGRYSFD